MAMTKRKELTSADYAAMAQSYEEEPHRRDELVGEPYVAPSAMQLGRPRGGGDPRGASPTRALRLPADLDTALAERASQDGVSLSDVMRQAVFEYLERPHVDE